MYQLDIMLGKIEQKYRLELKYMELQSQNMEHLKQLPQALYRQRKADEDLRGYENGSFRALLGKIFGNHDSQLEEYRRESRYAASALEQLQREQQDMENHIAQIHSELAELSGCEEEFAAIVQTDAPNLKTFKKKYHLMAAVFHGKAALFYLEKNEEFLLMARESMKKTGQIDRLQVAYDRDHALEQADRFADASREHILAYNLCQVDLESEPIQLGEYFKSPTTYIVGVISEWGWLDQINKALEQLAVCREKLYQAVTVFEETLSIL